jgi:hypothetical protein
MTDMTNAQAPLSRGEVRLVVSSDLASFRAFYADFCELMAYRSQYPRVLFRAIADDRHRFMRLMLRSHEEIAVGTYRATLTLEATELFRELLTALRAGHVDDILFGKVVHCQSSADDGLEEPVVEQPVPPLHDTTTHSPKEAVHA